MYLNADPTTGVRVRNYSQEEKEVEIENIRGKEDSVTLDTAGFQFYRAPSKHTSFANNEVIKKEYYPESIELIQKLTGATGSSSLTTVRIFQTDVLDFSQN